MILAARGLRCLAPQLLRDVHIRPSSMVLTSRVTRITRPHPIGRHTLARSKHQTQRRSFNSGGYHETNIFKSADRTLFVLISANIAVTTFWVTADTRRKRVWMLSLFTTSSLHLDHGQYYTLLTSVFSHANMTHLLANMYALFFFGYEVSRILGPKRFLGLYLTSGVLSTWASVNEQKRSHRMKLNLGASGAVNSITVFSILLFPRSTLLVFGLIPIRAWVAGSLFIGRDLYSWLGRKNDGIGHFAHLCGAACGGLYYAHLRPVLRRLR